MSRLGRTVLVSLLLAGTAAAQEGGLAELVGDPARTLGPHGTPSLPQTILAPDGESKLVVYEAVAAPGEALPKQRATVVFAPGHSDISRPEAYLQLRTYLNSHGFTVAIFDFPSKGMAVTPAEWRPRFDGVVEQLEKEVRDPRSSFFKTMDLQRLALGGHSFGGALATQVSSADTVGRYKALFLFSSGSDYDKTFLDDARRVRVPTIALGGSYDQAEPPLENDRKILERVASPEKTFVYVTKGNHMNAPSDWDSRKVGSIRWGPAFNWFGFMPVFTGYAPAWQHDTTKTAIRGPQQKGITFPILTAWLKQHALGEVDRAGWSTTRLAELKALGLLEPQSFVKSEVVTPVAEAEPFSRSRVAVAGEVVASKIPLSFVGQLFGQVRDAASARTQERLAAAATESERANLAYGKSVLASLTVEVVETNDLLAERAGTRVRVSTGLLNEVEARVSRVPAAEQVTFRAQLLGLILAHESAHAGGLRSEKLADVESVKVYERAKGPLTERALLEAVEAFERPIGAKHVDAFFSRLRDRLRYGSPQRRAEDLVRAANGEQVDRFAEWRRLDGTLDWKRMTRDGALREGSGAASFALALFLKELAVVVRTGDRLRIEEFFEGLLSTDFYVQYGLFVAGAKIGDAAYSRYLQRFVKPGFVSGLLRTNLVLAAGIALPMVVEGRFEGRAYAISLMSLGLSVTAVKAGVSKLQWVLSLEKARAQGLLTKVASAGRLARIGGWFYAAVELAVVLYVAEAVEHEVNARLETAEAEAALNAAREAFARALQDPDADLQAAADAYHAAWNDYRLYLYRPLEVEEARMVGRMEKLGTQAKQQSDQRRATLERLLEHRMLRANVERRYGSVEAYADHLLADSERELEQKLGEILEAYTKTRDGLLEQVYQEGRLQTYADESAALQEAADRLRAGGRDDAADVLEQQAERVRALELSDRRLYYGTDPDPAQAEGMGALLEAMGE